ncbi:MAG: hypothetical protein J6T91_02705 [Alphaproteobacteria bacterium]|nr:hypothetical protein [Alphaproteobacteria bacterium]
MKKVVVGAAACVCCVANGEFVHELNSEANDRLALTCINKERDHCRSLQKNVDDTTNADILNLIEEQFPLLFQIDSINCDEQKEIVSILKDRWQSQDYTYEDENGWKATWSKSI